MSLYVLFAVFILGFSIGKIISGRQMNAYLEESRIQLNLAKKKIEDEVKDNNDFSKDLTKGILMGIDSASYLLKLPKVRNEEQEKLYQEKLQKSTGSSKLKVDIMYPKGNVVKIYEIDENLTIDETISNIQLEILKENGVINSIHKKNSVTKKYDIRVLHDDI